MKYSNYIGGFFLALLLAFVSVVGQASDGDAEAAEQAALEWLALVDDGKYETSWNSTTTFFQGQISSSGWVDALESARKPLGDVITRELSSATLATSLPGAPDGQYVVLQFKTAFSAKLESVEIITPALEDGQWKVSGYFIQ